MRGDDVQGRHFHIHISLFTFIVVNLSEMRYNCQFKKLREANIWYDLSNGQKRKKCNMLKYRQNFSQSLKAHSCNEHNNMIMSLLQ